jgi:hypothetical protein
MATRKPLFLGEVGAEEMAAADDIALGGLAMSGNITMGSNKITGLAAATASGDALSYGQSGGSLAGLTLTGDLAVGDNQITGLAAGTDPDDAVNKAQLDSAVINGGQVKEQVLHENQLNDTEGVLAATVLTMANNPTAGDTIIITDGTTTRTYGATSGGDVQYTIGATVADTMSNLAAAIDGDGSAIWGAAFLLLESIDTDGVVVIVEDDNDGTASQIYATWATQADIQYVNFGGADQYNSSTLAAMPSSAPGSTNFGFRRTTASLVTGEMHNARNNDTMYSWDDDAATWQQMNGSGSIPDATSASGGGIKGKVTVDREYGLLVNSGILRMSLASNKGLGFDGGGDLQGIADTTAGMEITASGFAIDIAATTPGLGFDGSGDLEVKLDGTTLEKTATGLRVKGLPSLFEVNGVAVGATVTAANLDTLTDGSNADALHSHTISATTRLEDELTAEEALNQGDPIEWGTTNNQVRQCRANTTARVDCMAVVEESGGISASGTGTCVRAGVAVGVLSGATVGDRIYVGNTGGLVTGIGSVSAGNHVIFVGTAKNATDLEVKPQYIGKKAA